MLHNTLTGTWHSWYLFCHVLFFSNYAWASFTRDWSLVVWISLGQTSQWTSTQAVHPVLESHTLESLLIDYIATLHGCWLLQLSDKTWLWSALLNEALNFLKLGVIFITNQLEKHGFTCCDNGSCLPEPLEIHEQNWLRLAAVQNWGNVSVSHYFVVLKWKLIIWWQLAAVIMLPQWGLEYTYQSWS